MNTFLVILLIAAMLATVVALVRGVVSFLQESTAEVKGGGPSAASLKSNRMMQQRIFFQAAAVVVVVLLLVLGGGPEPGGERRAMVKLNRIYTRTGDTGTTGLVDGSRVSKTDARMAAIGDVDEANSAIGVALATLPRGIVADELALIQNDLFDLGADLATPGAVDGALRVVPGQVERLERAIDGLNADLAPLTSFILPGGTAASLHLARAIVRRAERAAVAVDGAGAPALAYLNRLSDYLFVAGRVVNAGADPLWRPGATR